MIDKLVKERMPKSSADYIIRKAAESSLLGLSQTLNRSPLAEEIEKRGEAAYRPGKIEKGAGWVLGTAADTVMLGGVGSWATLVYQQGRVRQQAERLRRFPQGGSKDTCQEERDDNRGQRTTEK